MEPYELQQLIDEARQARARLFTELENVRQRDHAEGSSEGVSERVRNLNTGVARADAEIADLEAQYGRQALASRASHPVDAGIGMRMSDAPTDERMAYLQSLARAGSIDEPRVGNEQQHGRPQHGSESRNAAMRTIDGYAERMDTGTPERLEALVREDGPQDWTARYVNAVGDPHYASAFGKVFADRDFGHTYFTPAEQKAWTAAKNIETERSMVIGTGSSGGFLLPYQLDPTIMMSGNGSINPIRRLARVETTTANVWKGVSSDGVTAQYRVEGATMTDNSPTLAQPTVTAARWDAFVPYSWELGQDDPGLVGELVRLIADGRDQLESSKFYNGSGTAEPRGIMSGLSATQRVATSGATAFAYADVWALKAAVPARFVENLAWVAHPKTYDTAFQFVGGNSTSPLQFDAGRGGPLLGKSAYEWSSVGTQWTTTSGTIAIAGDFRAGYLIADRLGLTAVPVPVLFSGNTAASFGYPNGLSGLAVWGRTGADVVNANALRALVVS